MAWILATGPAAIRWANFGSGTGWPSEKLSIASGLRERCAQISLRPMSWKSPSPHVSAAVTRSRWAGSDG